MPRRDDGSCLDLNGTLRHGLALGQKLIQPANDTALKNAVVIATWAHDELAVAGQLNAIWNVLESGVVAKLFPIHRVTVFQASRPRKPPIIATSIDKTSAVRLYQLHS